MKCGEQQRGIMVARNEDDAVRARCRETPQRLDIRVVSGEHAIQPAQHLGLRASGGRGRTRAIDRFKQLEGVTVQDQVDRAAAVGVDGLKKSCELRRPTEILLRAPGAGSRSAFAHVEIADDDNGPRRWLWLSLRGQYANASRAENQPEPDRN